MSLSAFKNYLIASGVSTITAKNYVSDINKFFKWFHDNFQKEFTPDYFSSDVLELFIKTGGGLITGDNGQNGPSEKSLLKSDLSPRSFERYTSSLRRFGKFLAKENLIGQNPFDNNAQSDTQKVEKNTDPWKIKDFKNHLYVDGASSITSKNYLLDINAFTTWLALTHFQDPEQIEFNNITAEVIAEYTDRLINSLELSESTVNRKLSSIRKYLGYLSSQNLIEKGSEAHFSNYQIEAKPDSISEPKSLTLDDFKESIIEEEPQGESSIPPVRLFTKLAAPYVAFEDTVSGKLATRLKEKRLKDKATRPQTSIKSEFYKKSDTPDLPLGKKLIHHARFTRPVWYKRYHSLSISNYIHVGVLVIYASAVGFMVYSALFPSSNARYQALAASAASGKTLSFQGVLTDKDNNPINAPTNVRFLIYDDREATGAGHLLWQEVNTVQPSQNGSFTQTLGTGGSCDLKTLAPTSSSCQIPEDVFTRHTRLYIGMSIEDHQELAPRQELTQVNYAANTKMLSGMLPITDTDRTSNVILALDSSGNLTVGGNNDLVFTSTGGEFKLSGTGLVLATNLDTNRDVTVSPDGTGRIDLQKPIINSSDFGSLSPGAVQFDDKVAIQATESAVAAFMINNNTTGGDIFTASSSGATRFTIANNGDLSIQPGALIDTLGFGTLSIGKNNATTLSLGRGEQKIVLPGYTNSGGILYTNGIGELAQITPAEEGKCLISNGSLAPYWGECKDQFFHYNQGALAFNNLKGDFLIGGESTSSAKFAFYNVASGVPTAAIHGNLNVLANNGVDGRLAIGTTDPQALLHVKSYQDTSVLRLEDQDGTCEHNPEAGVEIVSCSSDERLKTDIVDATGSLSDLMKFKIRDYIVKASGQKMTGVIAQEVQQIFPDMVHTDSKGYLMVETPSIWKVVLGIQEIAASLVNFSTNSLAVATDNVTIAGKNLNDYIVDVVQRATDNGQIIVRGQIVSPLASIDELRTNIISPIGQDKIKINGKVVIANKTPEATSSPVLEVDGDASILGELSTNSLETNNLQATDATISGTLYADNIQAGAINGLDEKIASAASALASNQASPSSELIASIINTKLSELEAALPIYSTTTIDVSNLSANFGTFRDGLIALGPATFGQATFLDGISIGTNFILGQNSIDTLGQTLEIQPLKQGAISLMAGAVKIDTDGNVKFSGDVKFAGNVEVSGKLSAEVISPLSNKNIVIADDRVASDSATNNNLVDVRGSITASGSATIGKLNLSLVEPAYAVSDIEVVATGSAGTATIKRYRTELTIDNPNVTARSLIYITPVGPNNQSIYLLRQAAGKSFTAGVGTPATTDMKFNWIIVN